MGVKHLQHLLENVHVVLDRFTAQNNLHVPGQSNLSRMLPAPAQKCVAAIPDGASATCESIQNCTRAGWPSADSSSSSSTAASVPNTSCVNRKRCTSGTENRTSTEEFSGAESAIGKALGLLFAEFYHVMVARPSADMATAS